MGDLKNRGLAGDVTFTGTPVYGTGKLWAQALFLDKLALQATVSELQGITNFTVAYWIKVNSTATFTDWADAWQIQMTTGGTTSVMRDELRNTSYKGAMAVHMVKDSTVGSNTNIYYGLGNYNNASDKWCHVAVTKDENRVKQYVNGVLRYDYACSNFENEPGKLTGYFQFGQSTSSGVPVWLQDWRFYDEVISHKEIYNISRGIMVHYQLSTPGNENLAVGTNQVYTSPASTGGTSGSAYINNVYLTLSEGEIAENDEFTLSYNYEVTGNSSTSAFIYDQLNGSQSVPVNYCYMSGQAIETGKHVHTFKANATQAAVTGNQRTRLRLRNATDGAVLKVWNLKLEHGNKATLWIPSVNDNEYASMGFNDNIEYDVSGYGHDLTKTDVTYESGSPRYSSNFVFNGSTSTAKLITTLPTDSIMNEATFAFWIKKGEYDSTNRYIYYGITSIYFNASTDTIYFQWEHGTDSNNYSRNTWNTALQPAVGEWHHVAITFNNGAVYRYLDGQNTGLSDRTGTGNAIVGIRSTRGALANTSLNGSLSDFRIYATALSDDDILALYNSPISLANNGTLFANEFVEN